MIRGVKVVNRSDLMDWQNGNVSDLSEYELIKIAEYYEYAANNGFFEAESLIIEDM